MGAGGRKKRAKETSGEIRAKTLTFFGIQPGDTVLEIWPGRGWYSNILAPYLNAGGGAVCCRNLGR